jgi:hypothetical protein
VADPAREPLIGVAGPYTTQPTIGDPVAASGPPVPAELPDLPPGALGSAVAGAAALDVVALTGHGHNLLRHALRGLQRDGYLTDRSRGDDPRCDLLTAGEHRAMELTVDLYHRLCRIARYGLGRSHDLAEVVHHVHALQRVILAQAAARAYPDRYRLLGGDTPGVAAGEALPPIDMTGAL